MKVCGLLGRKLGHSYSPQIHQCFGRTAYTLIEKEPEELEEFLTSGEFDGLNVTIPYKRDVMPYCSALSDTAKAIGSVNTIIRRADGSLFGDNTDAAGFSAMLDALSADVRGKKCLVCGSGGASLMAQEVLKNRGGRVIVLSRTGEETYENLQRHADAAFIVNATPLGMYPHAGESPVDLSLFPCCEGVLDLVYNPARTKLLMEAERLHIPHCGGLLMLVEQAGRACELWTGEPIDDDAARRTLHFLRGAMQNIVLIGMPGCGKSAVGRKLADLTGRELVDADAAVVEKIGMDIPSYFALYGEEGFRKVETEVLASLGQRSAIILSTGGGCITREENYPLLHQNGVVLWLKRDLDLLSRKGRPLSQGTDLEEMYRFRAPLYAHFADAEVESTGVVENTAKVMLEVYDEIIGTQWP